MYSIQELENTNLASPSSRIMAHSSLWPPNGFILHIVLFDMVLLSQILVFCLLLCQSIGLCFKSSFWFQLQQLHLWLCSRLAGMHLKMLSGPHQVFTAIYALSSSDVDYSSTISWELDSFPVVVDNSANIHI